jgi:hypothetical protein
MNKKTMLIIFTSLTATFVALCAAFFSVTGIAKLFAGATLSALIMASALELGKIVGISFLYQYWKEIPRLLKVYLTTASSVLMLITSIGIYGFLSAAYQVTADKLSVMDQQTSLLSLRKERYQEELNLYLQERDRLSVSIENLNRGLAGNVVQYIDQQTGQLITTTSSANRTALQEQLRSANEERTRLAERIEITSDSITSLDLQILDISINNDLAAEIGPLRFVSNLTGWQMDQVVNAFAIMIVLVFDPLAIALIISVNFLLKYKIKEESIENKNVNNLLENIQSEPYKIYIPVTEPDKSSDNVSVNGTITQPESEEKNNLSTEDKPDVWENLKKKEESDENLVISSDSEKLTLNTKDPPEREIVEPSASVNNLTKMSDAKRYEEIEVPPKIDWDLIAQFFKYRYGGLPNWMHPNFDWNNNQYNWKNNPLALQYKSTVVDKQK